MGEMLEQLALFQKRPEHAFAVIAVARPQDMVLRPHHIAHRVDLQEPQIADDLHDAGGIQRAGGRVHQPVRRQPQPPQVAIGDADAVGGDAGGYLCGHLPPMAQTATSPQCRQGALPHQEFSGPPSPLVAKDARSDAAVV